MSRRAARRTVAAEPLDRHRFALGECARWDGVRLTVVDVHAGDLWACTGQERLRHALHLDVPLGAANPAVDGGLVLAAGTGVALLQQNGTVSWLARPAAEHPPALRMNDAAVDTAGNLWCGSMDEAGTVGSGALYRVRPDGSARTMIGGLGCPNGPAFGPDGTCMYLADSTRGVIWRYPLHEAGEIGSARAFANPPSGLPDGMAVDGDGVLWVALWGGSALARYAPDGTLIELLAVPVQQPTSVAFVRGTPVITSARAGLTDPAPLDGAVLLLGREVLEPPVHRFGAGG